MLRCSPAVLLQTLELEGLSEGLSEGPGEGRLIGAGREGRKKTL